MLGALLLNINRPAQHARGGGAGGAGKKQYVEFFKWTPPEGSAQRQLGRLVDGQIEAFVAKQEGGIGTFPVELPPALVESPASTVEPYDPTALLLILAASET